MPIDLEKFIQEHGSDAYDEAVRLCVFAVRSRDTRGAKAYSRLALELLLLGYYKPEQEVTQ